MGLDKYQKRLNDLLAATGARVIREKRHIVYRLANGRRFVQPSTGSDRYGNRHAFADLRRLSERTPARTDTSEIKELPISAENQIARSPVPNWSPREHGDVFIPHLSFPSPCKQQTSVQDPQFFPSIDELLDQVETLDDYWELDSCGRVRTLMKLLDPDVHAQPVLSTYCIASAEEIRQAFDHSDPDALRKQFEVLFSRMSLLKDWGFSPALSVSDPVAGDCIVEPCAMARLGFEEGTICAEPNVDEPDFSYTFWPVYGTNEAEQRLDSLEQYLGSATAFVLCVFVKPEHSRMLGLNFKVTPAWTDLKYTRSVVRQLRAAVPCALSRS